MYARFLLYQFETCDGLGRGEAKESCKEEENHDGHERVADDLPEDPMEEYKVNIKLPRPRKTSLKSQKSYSQDCPHTCKSGSVRDSALSPPPPPRSHPGRPSPS